MLAKVGAGNAHLTDLYKRRGLSGALLEGLPADFAEHLTIFRQEIDILKPKRVIALGHHAYGLLAIHIPEIKPLLMRMWHFAYVVRYNKIARYEANIREALEAPNAFAGCTRA